MCKSASTRWCSSEKTLHTILSHYFMEQGKVFILLTSWSNSLMKPLHNTRNWHWKEVWQLWHLQGSISVHSQWCRQRVLWGQIGLLHLIHCVITGRGGSEPVCPPKCTKQHDKNLSEKALSSPALIPRKVSSYSTVDFKTAKNLPFSVQNLYWLTCKNMVCHIKSFLYVSSL